MHRDWSDAKPKAATFAGSKRPPQREITMGVPARPMGDDCTSLSSPPSPGAAPYMVSELLGRGRGGSTFNVEGPAAVASTGVSGKARQANSSSEFRVQAALPTWPSPCAAGCCTPYCTAGRSPPAAAGSANADPALWSVGSAAWLPPEACALARLVCLGEVSKRTGASAGSSG